MIEGLLYTEEKGTNEPCDITVFALSTCGFCKRGLKFLRDNSIKFKYIYVDHLDEPTKEKLKASLTGRFNTRIGYPFLVMDDKEFLRGFVQHEWEQKLLV